MVTKLLLGSFLAGSLIAGLSAVVYAGTAEKGSIQTLRGTIIDNSCATANKGNLADFVKTHTKDCALMPGCVASGYSLFTEGGKLIAFTDRSNGKIKTYLTGPKTTLTVVVKAATVGEKLDLRSIKTRI